MDVDVAPYRIERRLAEGGMGVVYAAVHPALERRVALKVLHPHIAAHPEALERFRREAQALAKLEHPHAVRIYDFVATPPRPFLVMEYVEGTTLSERLAAGGPLSFEEVASVADQVLEVLEVAHAQGVVHRDLKPANLMVDATRTPAPFIRVVDFGVALLTHSPQARLTEAGQALGTAEYMSPEQVSTQPLDARSDLYSLACVLFELLTGRPPFVSTSPVHILSAHLFREPPRLEEVGVAHVPVAWQAALRRALSKPREARFESAAQMRKALADAQREGARGPEERAVLADARLEFVAAEVDDPPVALVLGPGADAAAQETVATALAGAGVTVASALPDAGVAVVLGRSGREGLEEAARLAAAAPGRPVLLCGGEDELDVMTRSIERGVFDYLPMPLEEADVAKKVVRALKARRRR